MVLIPLRKYSPRLDTPYLTISLIAINCTVYLYSYLFAGLERVAVLYGFMPANPVPHAWVTHMFIHGGLIHLIGNMFFLHQLGMIGLLMALRLALA